MALSRQVFRSTKLPKVTTSAKIPGIRRILRLLSAAYILPFQWDSSNEKLVPGSVYRRSYWLVTGPLLHSLQALCVMWQYVKLWSGSGPGGIAGNLHLLRIATLLSSVTITYGGYSVLLVNTHLRQKETVNFVNDLLHYRTHLAGTKAGLRKDIRPFYPLTIMLIARTLAVTSVGILSPSKPPNAYSILPLEWQTGTTYIFFIMWHVSSNVAGWMGVLFNLYVLFMYVETLETAMKKAIAAFTPDRVNETLASYRLWLVYRRIFEEAYGNQILPSFLVTLLSLVILSTFGVIRFFAKISLNLYTYFLLPFLAINMLIYSFLKSSARIHEVSKELKFRLGEAKTMCMTTGSFEEPSSVKLELRQQLRSLPNMYVSVGWFFSIEKLTTLAVFSFTINSSISLLLNL